MPHRRTVNVDGVELSVVANRPGTPRLLLLHGTFWSRVWTPIMAALGDSTVVAALDFPGFGPSGGELDDRHASVPDLAGLTLRSADVLGARDFTVAGHDIGGAVAQHLAVHASERVRQLVLVNSVLYDSWPVPAVARFRDLETRVTTTPEEFRDGRRLALGRATTRDLGQDATAEYLSPWQDERRIRSWMAMAAAADARYTLDLLPALREQAPPTLLLWGAEDEFQPVSYAERFTAEVPSAQLVRVAGARHIPMEDDPERGRRAVGVPRAHHDHRGGRMRLLLVRVALPAAIAIAGVVLLLMGGDAAQGAGIVLIGVAGLVVLANALIRLGLQSERDREGEEARRRFFSRRGRWPRADDQ